MAARDALARSTKKAAAPALKSSRRAVATRFVRRVAGASDRDLERLDGTRARLVVEGVLRLAPLQANGKRIRDRRMAIEWRVWERDGGASIHTMTFKDGRCRVRRGVVAEPDLQVGLSAGDFLRLVAGVATGPELFADGRLKIAGDLALAIELPRLFSVPRR